MHAAARGDHHATSQITKRCVVAFGDSSSQRCENWQFSVRSETPGVPLLARAPEEKRDPRSGAGCFDRGHRREASELEPIDGESEDW